MSTLRWVSACIRAARALALALAGVVADETTWVPDVFSLILATDFLCELGYRLKRQFQNYALRGSDSSPTKKISASPINKKPTSQDTLLSTPAFFQEFP